MTVCQVSLATILSFDHLCNENKVSAVFIYSKNLYSLKHIPACFSEQLLLQDFQNFQPGKISSRPFFSCLCVLCQPLPSPVRTSVFLCWICKQTTPTFKGLVVTTPVFSLQGLKKSSLAIARKNPPPPPKWYNPQ